MIIINVITMQEYGDPNSIRRLSANLHPPPGIPYEYNYWDYLEAWNKVLLYQNSIGLHS